MVKCEVYAVFGSMRFLIGHTHGVVRKIAGRYRIVIPWDPVVHMCEVTPGGRATPREVVAEAEAVG